MPGMAVRYTGFLTKKAPKGDSVIIRETFSIPPDESAALDAMRVRAAKAGVMLNRSEIVRAGIAALRLLDKEMPPLTPTERGRSF